MSPLKNHNSLWDSIGDVEHQHSGVDNRVECLRAGDVEQAVDDAEPGREECCSDGDVACCVDFRPIVREWQAVLRLCQFRAI